MLPSSGKISIKMICQELGLNFADGYNLSELAANSKDPIPQVPPHALSDWYGYQHLIEVNFDVSGYMADDGTIIGIITTDHDIGTSVSVTVRAFDYHGSHADLTVGLSAGWHEAVFFYSIGALVDFQSIVIISIFPTSTASQRFVF